MDQSNFCNPPMEPTLRPSIRADHVGSLLRPPELLAARQAYAEGRLDLDALRQVEDRVIGEALRRQRDIGLDVVSDGEMRRASWLTGMAEAVDGFTQDRVLLEWKGPEGRAEATTARVAGAKLRKTRMLTAEETPFLARHAGAPFKVTLPAPSNFMLSSYKTGVTDRVYGSRGALLQDVVEILSDEVRWLIEQGARYVQFDAPYYSHYVDERQREHMKGLGLDPDHELDNAIAGDNAVIEGFPREGMTFALHVCRGNNQSRWYTEGSYDAIAERLFGGLKVDRLLLEFDDERSGGFEPLRHVRKGRTVVLGLITSKRPQLESTDALRRRIDDAARVVPIEQLAISPQCGFASIVQGNRLTMDEQWRKLERVVEVARSVWQ